MGVEEMPVQPMDKHWLSVIYGLGASRVRFSVGYYAVVGSSGVAVGRWSWLIGSGGVVRAASPRSHKLDTVPPPPHSL